MRGAFGCGRRGEEISLLLLKTLQKILEKTTLLLTTLEKTQEKPSENTPLLKTSTLKTSKKL